MKHLLTKFKYYNEQEKRNREYIGRVILGSEIPEYKEEKRVFFCQHRYILGVLTEREAEILPLYYGLDDVAKSYGQISADVEVTRERVRQILLKVFRKLRHPVIARCLLHFNDLEIGCDRNNYKEFNIDKLNEVYKQRLEAKGLERFQTLSDKEKEAELLLDKILQVRPRKLDASLIDMDYGSMLTLLSATKEELNSDTVSKVHALGLYFCCECEYEEEWLNKCREGIINVGIEKLYGILGTVSSNEIKLKELLETPLDEVGFSNRTFNCLRHAGVKTLEDMVKRTENDYIKIRNLGRVVLNEIQLKLQSLGLDFRPENINIRDWMDELAQKHGIVLPDRTEEENVDTAEYKFNKLMNTAIEDLDFSVRTYNCLKRSGVDWLKEVVSKSEGQLFRTRNLGRICFDEIVEKLNSMNLSLRPQHVDAEDWLKVLAEKHGVKVDKAENDNMESKILTEENVEVEKMEGEVEQVEAQEVISLDKFEQVLNMNLRDAGLSAKAYVGFRYYRSTVGEVVKLSKTELMGMRFVGEDSFNEVVKLIHSLGLEIRPEQESVENWMNILRTKYYNMLEQADNEKTDIENNRLISKMLEHNIQNDLYKDDPVDAVPITDNQNVQVEFDINEIPEKYRRVYAIGAGVEAERQMRNRLNERLFVSAIIKNAQPKLNVEADKSSTLKIKSPKQDVNELTDNQILSAIKENIIIMDELDISFIEKYRRELTIIILENNTIDTNKKLDLINFVNNTTTYSV